MSFTGPAIIEEPGTTIVILPALLRGRLRQLCDSDCLMEDSHDRRIRHPTLIEINQKPPGCGGRDVRRTAANGDERDYL